MRRIVTRLFWVCILHFCFLTYSHAQTINIEINWNHPIRVIPEYAYGVNSPANFIPAYSNDVGFMEKIELITQKKGLIRLHGWGMLGDSPESWQNQGIWNSVKINNALTPLTTQGYEVMINIPSGPGGEDDYQNPEAFAQFCADLVQIVNIDYQLGVEYWEIPNERESGFTSPGLTTMEMSNFIKTASLAMKAVDPSIKVGGAATAWVNIGYLTELVELTPEIDFISCHAYSGDCSNSLHDIYNIAQYAVEDLQALRKMINNAIPIFLTEYNLSFQGCDRIQSFEGAVYDAIIMTESIKAGIGGTCYWAIAPYSDMSVIIGEELTDNAHLFEKFNKHFHGELVKNNSSDSTKVMVYSTVDESTNNYSFCLINRTAVSQDVQLQMMGIIPDSLERFSWNEQNSYLADTTTWLDLSNGNLSLAPYSVTMYRWQGTVLNTSNLSKRNEPILLFPNPNSGIFYLLPENINKEYQVLSSVGLVLKSGIVKNSGIDLTAFPTGSYLIKVSDKKGNTNIQTAIKK